jgi:hypothetical protein
MARGGKREGAGRKRGTPNKATQYRQKKIEESGVTPLDVMLESMRFHYGRYQNAVANFGDGPGDNTAAVNELARAREAAKDAAPYSHPKLANVEHSGKVGGAPIKIESLTDAQLEILIERITAGVAGQAQG